MRVTTKPRPGTTPACRSDHGWARTAPSAAVPIDSRSNEPATIWSTQVRACSPDSWRVAPGSATSARTAPRRKMTTPSWTGATTPNARTSSGMRPMTHVARRAAIMLPGSSGSAAAAATRARSSPAAPSTAPAASGIRMTASPNRPTSPLPGSIPTCAVNSSTACSPSWPGELAACRRPGAYLHDALGGHRGRGPSERTRQCRRRDRIGPGPLWGESERRGMGLYRALVLPRIINALCGGRFLAPLRRRVCAGLAGEVVEIGFGSGLNVPFYPAAVTGVDAVEPADLGWRLAAGRIAAARVPVRRSGLDGQSLPFADQSHDAALSTWTLCTIPDAAAALREVRRVLRPGATMHFLEHGLAPDEPVRRWQRRLDPLHQRLAGGSPLPPPPP